MTDATTTARRPTPLWAKALLILAGVAFALLLAAGLLALFPDLIPAFANPDRYERSYAGTVIQVEYRPSMGDMFHTLPGRIRPPTDDSVIASYTLAWDADGFREPAVPAERYPIAAFGDSFTEGYNVALPWPDRLAELLETPVRNYGYRAYGPLEISRAAAEFAGREPRAWLLYAFFSGNDLSDANRPIMEQERSPFFMLPVLAEQAAENVSAQIAENTSDHYDFPMPVIIGGNYYELVILDNYLWWQLAPPEGFEASANYRIIGETMDGLAQAVGEETCLGFIFIPTKEQLYYPFVHEGARQWLWGVGHRPMLDDSQRLQLEPAPFAEAEEADFVEHLTDQHDAMEGLVASKERWHFIDLLPALQERVNQGELLYYPYDSHWNQAGHDLAAQVIANYLRGATECEIS
jgi:hypothetical protein